jgi:predicted Ser/Thr protein kinase
MDGADAADRNRRARTLLSLAQEPPAPPLDGASGEVAAAAADPARSFGRFVLLEELGRGGAGRVHRAWQTDLRRFVALKILECRDPEAISRFEREAVLAARLSHPNIVPVFESGTAGAERYIAMRYVEGSSLRRVRLEPRQAAEVLRDAARAVHYAHQEGVIHRDLKPHNILLDRDGRPWVTDFGVARPTDAGATMTASNMVVGTPGYMAPEQARGETADRRTDVYSLGATLYHALTGNPPFDGRERLEIMRKSLHDEPPPPRRVNPAVPAALEAVAVKCMEKDPARRYPDAAALADDLDRYLRGEAVLARRPAPLRRLARLARRRPWVAAALLGGLALGTLLAGQEFARAARTRDALRGAREALAAGRFDEAEALCHRALAVVPNHSEAAKRLKSVRVARLIEKARATEREYRVAREGREALAPRAPVEDKPAPLEVKIERWKAQARLAEADGALARLRAERIAAYLEILNVDPEDREARESLARVHFEEFEEADRAGDDAASLRAERFVRIYDDGAYAPRLFRGGRVDLETHPPGAEAWLVPFVTAPDRRRVPAAEGTPLGPCPLRDVALPKGSALILLRRRGFPDAALHVRIDPGARLRETVNLYAADEIGPGFVYVPAGPFRAGGDPSAYASRPAEELRTGDYFIALSETTCAEYRRVMGNAPPHAPCAGDEPVRGISWNEAQEYCARRSLADPAADYRLPTEEEWEKAARGADGRAFPWGDFFDRDYLRLPGLDVSPYGLRATAGGVREWCDASYDARHKVVRGGADGLTLEPFFRSASRMWFEPSKRPPDAGFRVVRAPKKR